ncbi:MAG: hypothetical protein QGG40_17425, partial [Myxococcota bacterium]|nr:hypothetical protein [Myxococcota bacterium]
MKPTENQKLETPTTGDDDPLVAHYREQLSSFIVGRPWIVAMDVLVGAARTAEQLRALGAERVLAIGASRGTGDLPDNDEIPCIDLGQATGGGIMDAIRASEELLTNLPPETLTRIDRFDPEHQARVVGTIFCSGLPIAGRRVLGARPESWKALEDKMIIDAFWDQAGVPRAPSTIVETDLADLLRASKNLDQGMGTVWVGDNRDGWHGGANLVRWVRTPADAPLA